MVRIFLCCIMDCESQLCVSSHNAESAVSSPNQNSPLVNQKIFIESVINVLAFINVKKNLGDERFDLAKHVL